MPFDLPHAPLDSPKFTGTPTAPTPGVSDNGSRVATTSFVQALARKPPPNNQPIQLLGDVQGRGTVAIEATVTGLHGRHLTADPPADTEVYVWNEQTRFWDLIPACFLGQQSDGNDLVQVSNGAGGFTGIINHVVAGTYPAANVTTDRHGLILSISSGVLDAAIGDAPSDGHAYGRLNATWVVVATEAFVTSQGYLLANQTITLSGDATGSGATSIPITLATVNANVGTFQGLTLDAKGRVTAASNQHYLAEAPSDGTAYGRLNAAWARVAPLASPVLTGDPQAPTPPPTDNDTSIATTAFVKAQAYLTAITLSGDLAGSGTTGIPATVTGIQGRHFSNAAPLDGQVPRWNAAANEIQWVTITSVAPPTVAIWDGGASIWDGGTSTWDG